MRGCSQWGSSNYRYFRISALDVSTRDSGLVMSEYEIQAEKNLDTTVTNKINKCIDFDIAKLSYAHFRKSRVPFHGNDTGGK